MQTLLKQIIDHPGTSLAIVGNLIIIESLLSVDNAAVLATMVTDLPKDQRKKALKYGILGAYIFRGLAMVFAVFLIKFWFLKPLGGLYLLYLVYGYWKGKQGAENESQAMDKKHNWLYRSTVGWIGSFWATVCLVEVIDMAFSIDKCICCRGLHAKYYIGLYGCFYWNFGHAFYCAMVSEVDGALSFSRRSCVCGYCCFGRKTNIISIRAFFSGGSIYPFFIEPCGRYHNVGINGGHFYYTCNNQPAF